jgi:hypothetical protein
LDKTLERAESIREALGIILATTANQVAGQYLPPPTDDPLPPPPSQE